MQRAGILFHLGFYEESERDSREAHLLNPAFTMAVQCEAMVSLYRGAYEKAGELMDRCLAMEPSQILANIFAPVAPILQGRFGLAREKLHKARQMAPEEPQLTCLEGLITAYEGDFKRAEQLADEAASGTRKSVTHTHHTWHYAAGVYAICGRPEKAMAQLRRCADLGLPNHLLFTSDPGLGALREHSEFAALLSELRRQHDRIRAEFSFGETSH